MARMVGSPDGFVVNIVNKKISIEILDVVGEQVVLVEVRSELAKS